MYESALLTVRQLVRPKSTRMALGFSLLASGLTVGFGQNPRYFGIAVIVAGYVALWNGFAFVSLARYHVFQQGSSLIPRLRSETTVTALALASMASVLPLVAAEVVGRGGATMSTVVLVAFALGWAGGPLLPATTKFGILALALGAGLGLNVALYGQRFSDGSEAGPWAWPGFIDPSLQQIGLSILALGLIVVSARRMLGAREDAFVMRRWWSQTRESYASSACGSGLHPLLLELLPVFARRGLPTRDNGRTQEDRLQRELFRYSLSPLSPAGSALFFLFFVLIMAWIGATDADKPTLFANPNLFLLNGVTMLMGGMNSSRFRRELMRPLSRSQLMDRLLAAMVRDGLVFAACLIAGTLLVHLLVFPNQFRSLAYWTQYLMSPGLVLLAFGVALMASRYDSRAGVAGFFVAWVFSMVAAVRMVEKGGPQEAGVWIAASIGVGLLGLALTRVARRSWMRAEFE